MSHVGGDLYRCDGGCDRLLGPGRHCESCDMHFCELCGCPHMHFHGQPCCVPPLAGGVAVRTRAGDGGAVDVANSAEPCFCVEGAEEVELAERRAS